MSELSTSEINEGLHSSYWRVLTLNETTSTQDELLTRNLSPQDVVVAEYQSKGRGRLDRSFESKKYYGLTFSFIYQPKVTQAYWGIFPLLVGASLAEVITDISLIKFKSKWPNDVISEANLKLAGILIEIKNNQIHCGIGINVNTPKADLPVVTATSLLLETGKIFDRNILLSKILNKLEASINLFENNIMLALEYSQKQCATLNKTIEVTPIQGAVYKALATGISELGELILDSGEKLHVGEIKHLSQN